MSRFAILLLAMSALTACKGSPQFPAEVTLEIDGQAFDYSSSIAEFDDHGGPVSVYLLPDDFKDGSSPYACLRFYSGNPVGHFWVRYSETGQEKGNSRPRFECFVPGTLADGTETLTWSKADGEERHRTETGEAGCKVSLVRQGDDLVLEFDVVATLEKRGKGGHGGGEGGGEDQGPRTITTRGRGVMKLRAGALKDDAELPEPWWPETVQEVVPPVEVPAADDDDSSEADDDDSGEADDDDSSRIAVEAPAEPAAG